jgi:hypothetical protein
MDPMKWFFLSVAIAHAASLIVAVKRDDGPVAVAIWGIATGMSLLVAIVSFLR